MALRVTQREGIDSVQARAREAAGMFVPRAPTPKVTEKMVGSIFTIECLHCGCTNAWPEGARAKDRHCSYCGKAPKRFTHDPIW